MCPPTDLGKNKCAEHSHIDSQRGNSPYLGKYCLLILDFVSELRQTRDLEYKNMMKPRLHLQLASSYPRNNYSEESWHFCTGASFCKGTA